MKKLFVFQEITAYGAAIRGIVHYSEIEAFNFSDSSTKSLNKLGWNLNLVYSYETDDEIGIKFDVHS